MPVRFRLVIDCADPDRLARFWAAALGYELAPAPAGFATWNDFYRDLGLQQMPPVRTLAGRLSATMRPWLTNPDARPAERAAALGRHVLNDVQQIMTTPVPHSPIDR